MIFFVVVIFVHVLCVHSGTGTGMSHRVAMRCVWWCITNHLLLPVWEGSTCFSGMTTTVKPRTTSSANTLRVLLIQYFNILLIWIENIWTHCWPLFIFSTEKTPEPSPSPNSTQTSKMCLVWLFHNTWFSDISDTFKVCVLNRQSEHHGCSITDVFPSSVVPWNSGTHKPGSTGWLTQYTLATLVLPHSNTNHVALTKSLSLSCQRLSFSSELGLHHHSHHPSDTPVTDSDWSLLLQTDRQTVRIQNKF